MQTGAAVGSGLGALVYTGLYAVLPEAIGWRALPAQEALPGFEPAALSDTRLHHLKITEFHF